MNVKQKFILNGTWLYRFHHSSYKTKAETLRTANLKEQENDNTASYFIDYVTQEMIDKFGADAVYKEKGLKILCFH